MSSARPRKAKPGSPPDIWRASPSESRLPHSRGTLAAALTGAVSLAIYVATLPPTVLGWDDGELIAATRVLGIAHPTGYPVYLLLAKLFDLLPFANPAVRLSLFSALCGAGAAAAIAWAAAELSASAPAGVLAGMIAAFNRPLWSQANRVEVYPLNALIVSLAIAVFVCWNARRRPRYIIWLALLAGLGLAHHRISVFFTVPLLAAAVIGQRPDARLMLKAAAAGAAPLLFYLYLPIRAAARPPIMWRETVRWEDFLAHVSGEEYYYHVFARPLSDVMPVASSLARDFLVQLTPGGIALAAVGLIALLRRQRLLSLVLLTCCLLVSIWNLGYKVGDVIVFFIPCALVISLWAGEGAVTVSRVLERSLRRRAPWTGPAVTAIVLCIVPASLLQVNWSRSTHRDEWMYHDAVTALFAQIEPDGVYVHDGHNPVALYAQFIEGKRRDIDIVSPHGELSSTLRDDRVRQALPDLIERYTLPYDPADEEARQAAMMQFAAALGEILGWARPIYCGANLSRPPRDVSARALWWDFYRISPEQTHLLAPAPESPAAEFPNGISLARVGIEPSRPHPGEVLRIRLYWRCTEPLEEAPFVVLSLSPRERQRRLLPAGKMLLTYGTWFAYGLCPLPPSPAGSAYRQEVVAITPTNAPLGKWELTLGLTKGRTGAVHLKSIAEFRVVPRRVPAGGDRTREASIRPGEAEPERCA